METIISIVKQLCEKRKDVEYIILESPDHVVSFQPNYERLNVGDKDLFDNVVLKKMSYFSNEKD